MTNEADLGTALGMAALRGVARTNLRLFRNGLISSDDFSRARRGAINDLIDTRHRLPEATTPERWDEVRALLDAAWTPDPEAPYPKSVD